MEERDKDLQELLRRIDQLSRQQQALHDEVQKLRRHAQNLATGSSPKPAEQNPPVEAPRPVPLSPRPGNRMAEYATAYAPAPREKQRTPWEKFIGENLLNKAGIAVLVFGIGIGTKYSIDHELINPLTRIILGYLSGMVLLAIALRLKDRHKAFSAVLLSGGMATLYFITYAAYSFYGFFPQPVAFAMMVVFTAFTVFASIRYDMEVISIIGLVGAYAVPFLLSDGSGRVVILFSYMVIINSGILFLSFKKYWNRLYYIAFVFTWLIFASWYAFSYDRQLHAAASLIFSTIFLLLFYAIFLCNKLIRKESLRRWDVLLMLLNSFIYFGYGYLTIESQPDGDTFLGLFTVLTALLHFLPCIIIYKTQDRLGDSFYFVAGMVLVFLTIAVPVQLEGNWVTLVWAAESALLFWVGRAKNFPVYEKISCILIVLAFFSLLQDWSDHYRFYSYYSYTDDQPFTIFLNIQFLTSMLVAGCLIYVVFLSRRTNTIADLAGASLKDKFLIAGVPLLAVLVMYFGIYQEIAAFWDHRYAMSRLEISGSDGSNYDQYNMALLDLKVVWLIIFSALFATGLCAMQSTSKAKGTAVACIALNTGILLAFMTSGLLSLAHLRAGWVSQDLAEYYNRGLSHVLIRYLCATAMVPLLWFNWLISHREGFGDQLRKAESIFFHFVILVFLSSEMIHWLELAHTENTFRLSLTILWGAYGLFLIVLGLSRNEKHIRIAAIVLFSAALVKLFAYDIADMSTILKTVVMIILGALLLMASFAYNKYKRSPENDAQ